MASQRDTRTVMIVDSEPAQQRFLSALLSRGGPLIHLEVSPQYPLVVDPDAFVCARGQLTQSFDMDVSWRSAIGQGSGEAFSLRWAGTGVVSIQPAER